MIRLDLKKRGRYIFFALFIIVASALLYNFIFEPIFKKWGDLNKQIAIKRTRLMKGLKLLEDQDKIINEYNSLAPTAKNISKILSYIEKQATSSGIKTSNIRTRPILQKELYKEYIIEIQIEGDISGINKFISRIIEFPISVTVVKFELRKSTEAPAYFKCILLLSKLII